MSRYRYNSGGVILDLKRNMSYHAGDIVDLLEGKDIHIAELRKQVREEVVEEVRERLKKANLEIMSPTDLYSYTDNFLYQVKKGRQIPG